jgi:hypothetical protein
MITTMTPVMAATQRISRPPLRCIGWYAGCDGGVDYPVSWNDAERDTRWIEKCLTSLGVSQGEFVAVVSTGHEATWYGPILDALNRLKTTVCPLEPARFELGRAEMFFRRFPISHVIGLDTELGTALAQSAGLNKVFARVKTVLARPDAYGLVQQVVAKVGLITPIGPALGLPCHEHSTVHIDESEWLIEDAPGGPVITAIAARAHRPVRQALGIACIPILSQRCRCEHGSSSIRIAGI